MMTKNKFKIILLATCLMPMAINSNLIVDSPKINITEAVHKNKFIVEKNEIITVENNFLQEDENNFTKKSSIKNTSNSQIYFIITVSVLVVAFVSLVTLLVVIKIRLKKIKDQETE